LALVNELDDLASALPLRGASSHQPIAGAIDRLRGALRAVESELVADGEPGVVLVAGMPTPTTPTTPTKG
jgi:hypothetical protein